MKWVDDALTTQKTQDLPPGVCWADLLAAWMLHRVQGPTCCEMLGKTSQGPTGQLGRFAGVPDGAWGSQRGYPDIEVTVHMKKMVFAVRNSLS